VPSSPSLRLDDHRQDCEHGHATEEHLNPPPVTAELNAALSLSSVSIRGSTRSGCGSGVRLARAPWLGLREVAFPFMEDVFLVTRHNVQLAVREGHDVVFVERIARYHPFAP
jgi:hypothetical protein